MCAKITGNGRIVNISKQHPSGETGQPVCLRDEKVAQNDPFIHHKPECVLSAKSHFQNLVDFSATKRMTART